MKWCTTHRQAAVRSGVACQWAVVADALRAVEGIPPFYADDCELTNAVLLRLASEFPSGEDVQRTVASLPRWMLAAIREHVGVPEDVVSVILVAAVGVEKEEL